MRGILHFKMKILYKIYFLHTSRRNIFNFKEQYFVKLILILYFYISINFKAKLDKSK